MKKIQIIQKNIDGNLVKLKREWNRTRGIWSDSVSQEFERNYLVPIVRNQKTIEEEIIRLEKIIEDLADLGVNIE